jgi:hypothetical protein
MLEAGAWILVLDDFGISKGMEAEIIEYQKLNVACGREDNHNMIFISREELAALWEQPAEALHRIGILDKAETEQAPE